MPVPEFAGLLFLISGWKGEHAYIGDGKIGPVTQKLYDTMTGMQWGKIPDTKGWIVPVEKKY